MEYKDSSAQQPRGKTAIKGVIWSGLTIVIPLVVNSFVFLITSRTLLPSDFGVVALAATLAGGAAAFIPSGFGDAIVQRQSLEAPALDSVFWLCVAAGVVIYSVLFLVSAPLSGLFDSPTLAVLLPVMGTRVIIDTVGIVPTALVSRSMAFHLTALRSLVASLAAGLICVGLIAADYGLWALVASALASSLIATTTMCSTAGWRPRLRFKWSSIMAMSNYGSYATGTKLIGFIGGQSDQAVVAFALGTFDLGLYNFSKRLYSMIGDVTTGALTAVAHPFFAGIQDDVGRVRRGFMTATFLSSVIAFPCFVGLAVVSHNLILGLFGEKWLMAVGPTRILCVGGLIFCVGVLQASLINSLGRAKWWFRYQLIANVINIPIVVLAAPHGITTMLIFLTIKMYMMWCIPVRLTLVLLSMRPLDYLRQFALPLFAAIIMGFALILLSLGAPLKSPTALLVLQVLVGLPIYFLVLFALARRRLISLIHLFRGFRRPGAILS